MYVQLLAGSLVNGQVGSQAEHQRPWASFVIFWQALTLPRTLAGNDWNDLSLLHEFQQVCVMCHGCFDRNYSQFFYGAPDV